MLLRRLSPLADLGALLFLGAAILFLHRDLAFTDAILGDYDVVSYFYPYREFASEALRQGRLPLWNPLIFGGAPFLANIQAAVFYPVNWLGLWLDAPKLVGWSLIGHYWLAGAAMYLFCRRSMSLNCSASLLGGMAYMLSGFLAAQAGHPNQVAAAAWLPLLFLCLDEAIARRSIPFAALGGLALTLQLLAGHPQESYYSGVALGLFAGYRVLWPRRQPLVEEGEAVAARRWIAVPKGLARLAGRGVVAAVALGVMVGLGAGNAAVQLLLSAQLTRHSIRSGGLPYELATIFSLPPWDVLRALLPAFHDYAFGEHIAYIGVVPLVLAVLAILTRRDHPAVPFFTGLATLSLVLALGKFTLLYPIVFDYVPGVALFRVPARWLLLFVFSVSVLAAIGLSSLALPRSVRPWSHARWRSRGLSVVLGLILVGFICAAAWTARLQGTLPHPDILLRWSGLALVGTLVALFGMRLAPTRGLALALVAISLAELGLARQGLGYLSTFPPQVITSLRPAQTVILEAGPGRVLSLAGTDYPPGDLPALKADLERSLSPEDLGYATSLVNLKETVSPNQSMSLGVPSLDGYDGGLLPLKEFASIKAALMDSAIRRAPPDPARTPPQADRLLRLELPGIPDTKLLSALGVKYIIAGKDADAWPGGVYYDLGIVRPVWLGVPLVLQNLPEFETTAVGLFTFLDGTEDLADGTPVARVSVTDNSGTTTTRTLRVGQDTAPWRAADARRNVPAVATPWRGKSGGKSYLASVPLNGARYPQRIQVEALVDTVTVYVHGVSLTDDRLNVSQTVGLDPSLKLIHVGDLKVYQNLNWVSPLYVTTSATVETDAAAAALALGTVAPDTVVLAHGPGATSPAATSVTPPILERTPPTAAQAAVYTRPTPEVVQTDVNLAAPGYVVFTESFYPGWQARIDGKEAEILPANSLFQAIAVPAGRHKVEFRFAPPLLDLGLGISRVSLVFTVLLLFGPIILGLVVGRVRRRPPPPDPPPPPAIRQARRRSQAVDLPDRRPRTEPGEPRRRLSPW